MKKLLIIFSLTFFLQTNSFGVTLSKALLEAYKNNPELNAERENISVSKQNLNISKSEFLPSITVSGSKSSEETTKLTDQNGSDARIGDRNPETKSIKIEQKIFQGFGGVADYKKNKIGLVLADAKLLQTEQKTLLKAVEAFSGLIFANEKFSINKRNVSLSERQVETDRIRVDRGQVSIADLAQSESSLAEAQAKFIGIFKSRLMSLFRSKESCIGPIIFS